LCERGTDTRHDAIEARIAVRKLDVSMDVILMMHTPAKFTDSVHLKQHSGSNKNV